MDEPTAALDEPNAHMVMTFLTKLAKLHRITMLCISHDRSLIRTYADGGYYEIIKNSTNERYLTKQKIDHNAH